jgi:hypothetical protein
MRLTDRAIGSDAEHILLLAAIIYLKLQRVSFY